MSKRRGKRWRSESKRYGSSMTNELLFEKKMEAVVLATINKYLPNQGSTEVSTSIAAIIAAPPGLSPMIDKYDISDEYDGDWSAAAVAAAPPHPIIRTEKSGASGSYATLYQTIQEAKKNNFLRAEELRSSFH